MESAACAVVFLLALPLVQSAIPLRKLEDDLEELLATVRRGLDVIDIEEDSST